MRVRKWSWYPPTPRAITSAGTLAAGDFARIARELLDAVRAAPPVDAAYLSLHGAMSAEGEGDPEGFLLQEVRRVLEVQVRMLSDGEFRNESHGADSHAGDTAVLQAGGYTIVTTSHAVSLFDRSLFLSHGQDPRHFDLVVVKSPHCQPRLYKEGAALYLNVDAPGSTSANLQSLGHTVCARPLFPLDEDVPFTPTAQVFRRSSEPAPAKRRAIE